MSSEDSPLSIAIYFSLFYQIVVKDMANSVFEFPCTRWLSESEDDGQISRDLILAGDNENFIPGEFCRVFHALEGAC